VESAPEAASSESVTPVESQLPKPGSFTLKSTTEALSSLVTQPVDGVQGATIAGDWVPLGSTVIAVAPATVVSAGTDNQSKRTTPSPPAASVNATILDTDSAAKYGASGVLVQLSRTDDVTTQTPIGVRIPTALLNGLYGADYASLIRWVQISADATDADAQTIPVVQDADAQALVLTPKVTSKPIIIMSLGGPISSSGTGSFAATSLKRHRRGMFLLRQVISPGRIRCVPHGCRWLRHRPVDL
jgi:hypothetical protein